MTVAVEVENRSGWWLDERGAARVVDRTLAAEGVADGEAGVMFVGRDEMADLNARHRGRAEATDVLSFPLDGRGDVPEALPRQLGDVVVCPDVAAEEGTPIATLLVHGALHLVGYDHEADDGAMLRRQDELLAEVPGVAVEPA